MGPNMLWVMEVANASASQYYIRTSVSPLCPLELCSAAWLPACSTSVVAIRMMPAWLAAAMPCAA